MEEFFFGVREVGTYGGWVLHGTGMLLVCFLTSIGLSTYFRCVLDGLGLFYALIGSISRIW
jgi:hypothetical protein